MIDPILSISFSMHSNKGAYALLLGSGVSRSSGIPTGWEVTLDLIRKLAHANKEICGPDPAKWYEEKFAEDADYSKLLNKVAKTSSERNRLLRAYFEPTEEEQQQNIKTPTRAHKSIARLVKDGYIKVILTTNFDRLMEKALDEIGVMPTVLSTTDSVNGAMPIVHTTCTIIKLHGDYLDTRIKNTPDELIVYDKQINKLLDRIFDEFGLIICGWSGEWDTALRKAFQRCKSRRFTTYWTVKDNISDKAQEIANFRKAELIPIHSADIFFEDLAEKILAINEFERPHPLSAQAAVIMMKKYLEEDKHRIRLDDLVRNEVEKLHENISAKNFPTQGIQFSTEELVGRTQKYLAATEVLQAMMITGSYWGNESIERLFVKSLERLCDCLQERNGLNVWINLRLYPALIVLYSAGLAALASENYELLGALLTKPQNKYHFRGSEPLLFSLFPSAVIDQNTGRQFPNMERRHTPASDHLVEVLRKPLIEYWPNENEYEDAFDMLEFLISLVTVDIHFQRSSDPWFPVGRYGWRSGWRSDSNIYSRTKILLEKDGESWQPLKAGMFGNSLERVNKALSVVTDRTNRMGWY